MKSMLSLAFALALAACATAPSGPAPLRSIPLVNASFETPPVTAGTCAAGWYCGTHAGSTSHRYRMENANAVAGRAAFCMDRLERENWALLNQMVPAETLRGARVRLSMSVRADAPATAPGAGPFLLAEGVDSNAVMHEQKLVNRTRGWERMAVEAVVPDKAFRLKVGVLFDADGTVCVDDVRLDVLPPA
jgi:hypothetical protein